MPNKNYLRGRAHEYAIKKKWEKDGWTVLRTAGSHGEFDLVAIREWKDFNEYRDLYTTRGEIVLIQAKSGKSAEREKAKLKPLKAKYEWAWDVKVELL